MDYKLIIVYSSFLKLKVYSSKPGFTADLLRDDKHKQIFGRIMAKFSTFLKEAGVQKKISK